MWTKQGLHMTESNATTKIGALAGTVSCSGGVISVFVSFCL